MKSWNLTVGPKGQITLPIEIRRKFEMNPKNTVTVILDGDDVRVVTPRGRLRAIREKYPPAFLPRPMTWQEITDIAHEEAARNVVEEMSRPDED